MRLTHCVVHSGALFLLILGVPALLIAGPLHDAAKTGDVDEVTRLLAEGDRPSEADEHGTMPIHFAAANGHADVIDLLIKRGASADTPDLQGRTPLQIAAIAGRQGAIRTLLSRGATINMKLQGGGTALHFAVLTGNLDVVDLLIQSGADVNAVEKHDVQPWLDGTPLHWAGYLGDITMVKRLIANGADPRIKNTGGVTPSQAAYNRYAGTRRNAHFELSQLLNRHAEMCETADGCQGQEQPVAQDTKRGD